MVGNIIPPPIKLGLKLVQWPFGGPEPNAGDWRLFTIPRPSQNYENTIGPPGVLKDSYFGTATKHIGE